MQYWVKKVLCFNKFLLWQLYYPINTEHTQIHSSEEGSHKASFLLLDSSSMRSILNMQNILHKTFGYENEWGRIDRGSSPYRILPSMKKHVCSWRNQRKYHRPIHSSLCCATYLIDVRIIGSVKDSVELLTDVIFRHIRVDCDQLQFGCKNILAVKLWGEYIHLDPKICLFHHIYIEEELS